MSVKLEMIHLYQSPPLNAKGTNISGKGIERRVEPKGRVEGGDNVKCYLLHQHGCDTHGLTAFVGIFTRAVFD